MHRSLALGLLVLASASCALPPRSSHPRSRVPAVAASAPAPLVETAATLQPAMAVAPTPEPRTLPPLVHTIEPAAGAAVLTIEVDQELVFVNGDGICHGLFSSSAPNSFDTGLLQPRARTSVHFAHPGRVQVYCSLHDHAQLTIHVIPPGAGR